MVLFTMEYFPISVRPNIRSLLPVSYPFFASCPIRSLLPVLLSGVFYAHIKVIIIIIIKQSI